MQFRRRRTVEDGVEPVVALEPLGRAIFVLAQGDDADTSAAFDLDEPDLDERLRVFRVWPAGDQIEAAVLRLDALDDPAAVFLVRVATSTAMRSISSSRTIGAICGLVPLGVRHDPGPAEVRDVGDRRCGVPVRVPGVGDSSRLFNSSRCCSAWAIRPSSPGTVCAFDLAVEVFGQAETAARSIRALRLISTCRRMRSTSSSRSAATCSPHGLKCRARKGTARRAADREA